MAMVALNAARTKVVPRDSLEARWMVDELEVDDYLKHAATQPKMQALMEKAEVRRLAARMCLAGRKVVPRNSYRVQGRLSGGSV